MVSVEAIDKQLPQTQCRECGYAGCMPYAQALAKGAAPINRCPPGGIETVEALGKLLNIDATPYLNEAQHMTRRPTLAVIDEAECIGCTKCIQACPVDAIVGSAKKMHSIIDHECTGCGLCVEPCPVDCIEMIPIALSQFNKEKARQRHQSKQARHVALQKGKESLDEEIKVLNNADLDAKKAYILDALARVKAKKSHE